MSGFEVYANQIRVTGRQLKAAADEVKGADPSGKVDPIATAIPGSQSAGTAQSLAEAWRARFDKWHRDAVAQGDKVIQSADAYDESDYAADVALRNLARSLGPEAV